MKFIAPLIFLALVGCSIDEVNMSAENKGDVSVDSGDVEAETSSEETSEETTTTTTETTTESTTTTSTTSKKKESREETARYEVVNANPENEEFVSSNYCAGSFAGECWIRSAHLVAYSDGTYKVSIEFWDSFEDVPYSIEKDVIEKNKAFLISEGAKIAEDDSFDDKFLWARVDIETLTIDVIYDWAKDGPGEQGDDLIESLEFVEVSSKE